MILLKLSTLAIKPKEEIYYITSIYGKNNKVEHIFELLKQIYTWDGSVI